MKSIPALLLLLTCQCYFLNKAKSIVHRALKSSRNKKSSCRMQKHQS